LLSFTLQKLNDFKSFSKLALYSKRKGEATPCLQTKMNFKTFDLKSFEIKVFRFRKQKLSKDFVFKTCIDFNPFLKSFTTRLPSKFK
jgi:hypothetical protein